MELAAVECKLSISGTHLSSFNKRDHFNCDEFGKYYKKTQYTTIESGRLLGKKVNKKCMKFKECINVDGSEPLPLLVIEHAFEPRCFDGFKPWEY